MKKVLGLLVAVTLVVGFTVISEANDKAPLMLTDAQMEQIVAGRAHQADAIAGLDHPSDVAGLVPAHVAAAHQAGAADLTGEEVAALMPGHVRRNP